MSGRRGGVFAWPATADRRVGRCLSVCLLASSTLTMLWWPAPAGAHIELVSSSPEVGAEAPLSLDRIRLVFGDDLFPIGNDVVVLGPDGTDMTSAEPTALANSLEARMTLVAPGRHTVSYRVVGQDGHVITGDLWFTAAADGLPLPSAAAASPARAPGVAVTPAAEESAEGVAKQPPGGTALTWLLGTMVGLAALLVFVRTTRWTRAVARARHDGAGRSPRVH